LQRLTPQKKAEAIATEADKVVAVIRRHCEEAATVREQLYAGLEAHKAAGTREEKVLAFEDLKAAKISSETLLNLHKIERQAWGLDAAAQQQTEITIKNPRDFRT
jgi:hypothetical protein